ncbi:UNVERIFIED_CONTAM: hypothetical protein Sindi_2530400 [Sesamum indicum]
MASVVEVLGVANGIVLERQGFGRPVKDSALIHYLTEELPQPPAAMALAGVYVDAGVLFVHRHARGGHASGEVGWPAVKDVAAHFPAEVKGCRSERSGGGGDGVCTC